MSNRQFSVRGEEEPYLEVQELSTYYPSPHHNGATAASLQNEESTCFTYHNQGLIDSSHIPEFNPSSESQFELSGVVLNPELSEHNQWLARGSSAVVIGEEQLWGDSNITPRDTAKFSLQSKQSDAAGFQSFPLPPRQYKQSQLSQVLSQHFNE